MLARRLATATAAGLRLQGISTGATAELRHQGEPSHPSPPSPPSAGGNNPTSPAGRHVDWQHLYSLGEQVEEQEKVYLATHAARRAAAAAADAERSAARGDRCECVAAEEDAERQGSRAQERQLGPDFYEQFDADRHLVLRSTWITAGAGSLADMRRRLEEHIRFISDLEADGWEVESPTDAHYACLKNPRPKPPSERRLAEAWDIVESWEREAEKWE